MPNWDIFHTDRLEASRDLSDEAVREGIASGAIRPDDLARPVGSDAPWARVGDTTALLVPLPAGVGPGPSSPGGPSRDAATGEDGDVEATGPPDAAEVLDEADLVLGDEEEHTVELRRPPSAASPRDGRDDWDDLVAAAGGSMPPPGLSDPGAPPAVDPRPPTFPPPDEPGAFDPLDEDDEAAAFTLADEPSTEADEIDLTAMVDVAFQLVLFFLVTATTLYFKTLEIPNPEPDDPDAVAQQMRTLDELLDEYILVEIDPQGGVEVDREPVAAGELTERLRQARADTLRTGMLLMADFATPHRNAVLAIDSANAVGLEIAIAKPSAPAE